MNKRITALLLSISCVLSLSACGNTSEIKIEDHSFVAIVGQMGELIHRDRSNFEPGEKVSVAFHNISGFQLGEDGKHWYDMSMEIIGPGDQVIFNKHSLYGELGHQLLPDGVAKSPVVSYESPAELPLGRYIMKITIMDKVSGKTKVKNIRFLME